MTLHPLIQRYHEQAKQNPKRIALPEAEDERVLRAAELCVREGTAQPVLVGDEEAARAAAELCGVSLEGIEIVDHAKSEWFDSFVQAYMEQRRAKGKKIIEPAAVKMLSNSLFFATMMVVQGKAAGCVAGAVNTTANVIRAALFTIGTRAGCGTISSSFLMILPDEEFGEAGALLYADCAVNPDPTAEQLAEIASETADMARILLGAEPRVAMLSFSTRGSAAHLDVAKVSEATQLLKERRPELCVDGEIQVDAALIPEIGQRKAPDSALGGRSNVLIFPDLNSGNIVYKVTERMAHAKAYGPFLQGIALPMSDLSRGASVDDIYNVIIVTSLRASD